MATTEARLKAVAKKKPNATCFFSGEVNANYAVLWEAQAFGAFTCEKVVNQLRELNIPGLRVKGVSMAVFSEKEVELLEVRCGQRERKEAGVWRPWYISPSFRAGIQSAHSSSRLCTHTHTRARARCPGSRGATRRSAPCGGRTLTPRKRRA
jgi:hypothetical protein